MNTQKLHYFSGLTITVFVGLHLMNHALSLCSPEKHIAWMNTLRILYRNPAIETLLLLAVLLQIGSGLKLFKDKYKTVASTFEKLHLWSGLYLAFFLVVHVGAVLVVRFYLHLDTNFYFGVAGLNTFPFNLFFIPYYGLAISSFFVHLACIHQQKMKQAIAGVSVHRQALLILAFGCLLTLVLLYGLTNRFRGVPIPKAYKVLVGE